MICAGCHEPRHSAEYETFMRFSRVSNALCHFFWDHDHQLPATLSELTPRYIRQDQLVNCVYLGVGGLPRAIIAYEGDVESNRASAKRLIVTIGFGVTTVEKTDLDQLLHDGVGFLLERLRESDVAYYEGDLQGALNAYREKFKKYPVGNNATVTGVLRGASPSKEQFHSTYTQEINSGGEEIDPWGTPYWIESDGENVRIKSAGPNRKFDQPDSPLDDDICRAFAGGSIYWDTTKF